MTTGSARARLAHGLKLDDLELSCPVLIGGSGSIAFSYQTPSPILREWSCTKYSRQRRHVQGRFAAKNAPAGQRQIRTISVRRIRPDIGTITSLRQPPPAAPAKDGLGRFRSARLVALTSFGLIAGRCRF